METITAVPKALDVAPAMSKATPSSLTKDRGALVATTFSQAVSILMRAPNYSMLPIAALESLLLPPLLIGQCRVGYKGDREKGSLQPAAFVAWALVSSALDRKFMQELEKPIALSAQDWSSGPHPWLIVAAGDEGILPGLLTHVQKSRFSNACLKMRINTPEKGVKVKVIGGARDEAKVPH